ncbi:MAG: hypothetical protein EP334_01325 [Gammaproteobacteria bacterium]|nr:MAG: hypothetical protein EP334_01325 [Gammaproteobacteria bacterium]
MQQAIWVVDIEASGLSPASYPIEVGVVNDQREYQRLITPAPFWTHWSPSSEQLHGISREQLYREGILPMMVVGELNRLLGTATVISDHVDWDSFWLKQLFDCAGIKPTFSIADINTLLSEHQMKAFAATLDNLRETGNYITHRALDDARMIHRALVCTLSI